MKLQLFINNTLYNELHLSEEEFTKTKQPFEQQVEQRIRQLDIYVNWFKLMFHKSISKASSWEIYLIAESKKDTWKEKIIKMLNKEEAE